MAKKAIYKLFNGTAFDEIHFKTSIEQVEGLQDALSNVGVSPTWDQVTGKPIITVSGITTGTDTSPKAVSDNMLKQAIIAVSPPGARTATSHTHDDRYYTETEMNTLLSGKAPTSHTHTIANVTGLQTELNDKVDKVSGKGLSTNDYTTTEKNKLAGIASGAEVNVQSNWNATSGDAFILNKPTIPTNNNQLTNGAGYITGYTETDPIFTAWNKSTGISITKSQVSDLIEATQSLSGLMSTTDKTRLDVLHALLEEDTANNVVDSINEVLAIFNNYPEGADLVTALANKVDKVTGKGLSTNDYTTTEKNKLSGIATGAQVNVGTNLSQGARNTTTLRVDSSTGNNLTLPEVTTSLAGLMSSTDKTKLNGIATGATANTGTVTNVSAGTQVSGLTLTVDTGSTTPVIKTSILNAANFRTAIGAGTSNLTIGTEASNAKAGNYHPTWAQVTGKPSILSVADGSTGTGTGATFVSGSNLKTIIDSVIGNYATETINNKLTSVRSNGATDTAYVSELGVKKYVDGMISSVYRLAGDWNAATNTPTLTASIPANAGKVYRVSVAGTRFGFTFAVGDKLAFIEGGAVTKWDNVDDVTSVAGKTGAVVLTASDVQLGSVNNYGIASQTAAQDGTLNNVYMTPLRTKDAINNLGSVTESMISEGTDTNNRLISAYDLNRGINNLVNVMAALRVPTSRTINGKPLSANITLTASDVGAGTSNLTIGTTSSTAKAGNYHPTYAQITGTKPPVGAQVNRTIATTAQAQAGTDNTTAITPLRVKEVLTKSPTLDLGTESDDGSVNIGNLSDYGGGPAITVDGANNIVAMKGDWNLLEGSLVGATGSWKQAYGGPSGLLSKSAYTTLTLQRTATYYNRPMMMEIRFGTNTTTYTNQIVTFNLGNDTSTTNSKTLPRTVSITDFDGRYLKTISVKVYVSSTGATNLLRVGPVKTLIGDFAGSPGTLTWTTESSDSLLVYIGKIWVMD